MDYANLRVKDTSLILSPSPAHQSSKIPYRVTAFFKKHGQNFPRDIDVRLRRLADYRPNSFTFLSFTKTGDYTGMACSQATYQRAGGKIIVLNLVSDIKQNPLDLKLYHKVRITLLNTYPKTSDNLLILSVFAESITREDSPLMLALPTIVHGKFSQRMNQSPLL